VAAEITAQLRQRINDGTYQPGDKLPPVRELMTQYGLTSYSTINQIIRDLTAEGLLTTRQRGGVYVREVKPRHLHRNLLAGLHIEYRRAHGADNGLGLFELMTGADDVHVTTIYDWRPAPERAAEALQLEPGVTMLERTFRYRVDDLPHQVTRSYLPLPTAEAAGLDSADAERPGRGTIAQLLDAGIHVDRAYVLLCVRPPSAAESQQLAIPPGTSVFEHFRTMYAGEVPVEFSTSTVPGDRIAYVFDINLEESP
jgi:GntR family transcriptional regulator